MSAMKVVLVLSSILCAVTAAPSRPIVVPDLPVHHVHAAPVAVVTSQSHAQDELGQYSYSYSNPHSSKVEVKTVDGITRGGYSYLDSHGLVQNVNYVSDDVNGFRVAASNLPLGRVTPQEDEPVVAHEKAKAVAALHEAAIKEAAEAAVAHENEVALVPVAVEAPVAAHTYASHSTPASYSPAVYSSAAPEVHVTPTPVSHYSPAVSPVVHITPTPHPEPHSNHPPKSFVTPVSYHDHPHSYATVELDTSDVPAPVPSPGAYFHPAHNDIGHSAGTYLVSSTADPTLYEEVAHPSPSPTPLTYSTPSHVADDSLAHFVHAPAPAVRVGPAPILHHRSSPLSHQKPTPFYHEAPAPVHAIPSSVVHTTPAPVYFEASTPIVPAPVVHGPAFHEAPTHDVPTGVAHATSAPVYHEAPVPVFHAVTTPAVHAAQAPVYHEALTSVVHATPDPIYHEAPTPVVHDTPTPAYYKVPTPAAHEGPTAVVYSSTPAPVYHEAPTPVIHEAPAPVIHEAPTHVVHKAPVAVVTSQSHAQDELGQYSYSYSNPLSSKVEVKTVDGVTRGGYSYLDSHGHVQNVNYVSDDHNGFQVAASNLPKPAVPVDIPDSYDVAAAKAAFFAEIDKAKAAAYYHH